MTTATLDPAAGVPVDPAVQRTTDAEASIKRHALLSAGIGLLPLPWVDGLLLAGTQLKLVNDLAKQYGVPFSENRGKSLISALVGGVGPHSVGYGVSGLFGRALSAIPVVGTVLGFTLMPALAYASTLAVGRVFHAHFKSGGTLLNFNVDATREHYRREFATASTNGLPADAGAPPSPVVTPAQAPVAEPAPKK